jgi:hypothetical protein
VQESPGQQLASVDPAHAAPIGLHDGAAVPPHLRTPVASGTHAWPLQHWSLNWQTCPGSMQHRGFAPS